MKHTLFTATLMFVSFATFAQDADNAAEAPSFFDQSSIISMVVGGVVGALVYVLFLKNRKKK